jgi:hypothetical protein
MVKMSAAADRRRAFITYAREDSKAFAIRLAHDLETAGANICLNPPEKRRQSSWEPAAMAVPEDCAEVIAVHSLAAGDSLDVMLQVGSAARNGTRIIAVIYGDCDGWMERFQHIDFRGDYEAGLATLLRQLGPDRQADRRPATNEFAAEKIGRSLWLPHQLEYWVEIQGGRLTGPNQPCPVDIPSFLIGRYPVTVYEYGVYLEQTFVKAPPKWNDQSLHPGRPVVYVNWYAATAYCEWAGVALPGGEQWEFAARGTEGRTYPWGHEKPTREHANFGLNVGGPTSVGSYPAGNTPEGVADMGGNVWEWTSASGHMGGQDLGCLRGSSFALGAGHLGAMYCTHSTLDDANDSCGFRCVREIRIC